MKKQLISRITYTLMIVLLALAFLPARPAYAAACNSNGTGNWNTVGTWSCGHVPLAADTVTIGAGHTVTVDTAAVATSVTITGPTSNNGLTVSGSNSLTISGSIATNSGSNNQTTTIAVGAGTLTAGSIAITGGGGNRVAVLSVSTGTIFVTGNITFAGNTGNPQLTFTGAGTLNIGGNLGTGGTFAPSTGTVNFNGAAQTVGPYSYYNLTLSGSGVKEISTGTSVANTLWIQGAGGSGNTQVHLAAGITVNAANLWLGDDGVAVGNWGGTTCGGSCTVSTDYFTNSTGYVHVTTGTLPVTMNYFHAKRQDSSLSIDWSTGTETGNVGFNLYMEDANGKHKLNNQLIPSTGFTTHVPQDYAFATSAELPGGEIKFTLEDIDIRGKTALHGPFALDQVYGQRLASTRTDWQQIAAQNAVGQNAENLANSRAVNQTLQDRLHALGITVDHAKPAIDLKAAPYTLYLPLILHGPGTTPAPVIKVADILVSQTGIQRLSYADLLAAGLTLSGQPAADLAVRMNGNPVPILVSGASTFGPGSTIEFYGQALDTLYTNTNVYTLWVDHASALRVNEDTTPANSSATPASYYMETALVNHNNAYDELSTTGDPWYDTRMVAYTSSLNWNYPLSVDHYQAGAATASLQVNVYGGTDYLGEPDHHMVTSLNGTQVADETFSGLDTHNLQVNLPGGSLLEGSNTLTISLPGDTGKPADAVYMNQYSLTYPRSFWAVNGGLKFEGSGSVFEVQNLPNASVAVYRLQNSTLTRLDGVTIKGSGPYTARFNGSAQMAVYYVDSSSAVLKPGLRAARLPINITSGSADYLIISHPNFISGLTSLVQARTTQGLSVRTVNVLDIYDQFNYGVVDPQAIKAYIAYAAQHMGTQYILLVGDDTYDYKDYLKLGSISFIPSIYMAVGDQVQFAPVDPKYADVNNDNLPDLAIGRFPVRTLAELGNVVSKTLAYAGKTYGKTAVFAADTGYSAASNALLATLPAGWTTTKAYLDEVGVDAAHATLLASINAGVALTSFTGHTDDWEWTWQGLFSILDAPSLTNTGMPTLIAQQGCWNNYYVNPTYDNMGDEMLNKRLQGAVGMFGATSLISDVDEQALGILLIPRLTQPGLTIGQAELQAKQALAASNPAAVDVFLGTFLEGDPAMMVTP